MMKLKKLSWATVLIESKETYILIDPLGAPIKGQDQALAAKLGEPLEPLISLDTIHRPNAIFITHFHPDHFDAQSILTSFGDDIPIYIPQETTEFARKLGFKQVVGANPNDDFNINHVRISASYSVDGYGTPQVSWVICDGEHTVVHCGIYHGMAIGGGWNNNMDRFMQLVYQLTVRYSMFMDWRHKAAYLHV
jgi:L-ascorbate metabolism protein UlaG (beta-lactamase superfamily)